jgi:hypothetical protein
MTLIRSLDTVVSVRAMVDFRVSCSSRVLTGGEEDRCSRSQAECEENRALV